MPGLRDLWSMLAHLAPKIVAGKSLLSSTCYLGVHLAERNCSCFRVHAQSVNVFTKSKIDS